MIAGASFEAQASAVCGVSVGRISSWMKIMWAPASASLVATWMTVAAASSTAVSGRSLRLIDSLPNCWVSWAASVNGPEIPACRSGSSRSRDFRRWITSTATLTRGWLAASSGVRGLFGSSPFFGLFGQCCFGGSSLVGHSIVAPRASASRLGSK